MAWPLGEMLGVQRGEVNDLWHPKNRRGRLELLRGRIAQRIAIETGFCGPMQLLRGKTRFSHPSVPYSSSSPARIMLREA
jgi:hypothetical protein